MKDYKLLLAGLVLLLLIVFIAIFTWLWISNRKNTDPLPIVANNNETSVITAESEEDDISTSTLYVQAEERLQAPLDDVIVSFESRYPHVQVFANYVPPHAFLQLADSDMAAEHPASNIGTDIIIAHGSLTAKRLEPLQAQLALMQNAFNKKQASNASHDQAADTEMGQTATKAKTDNQEARSLNAFSYALTDEESLDGVILSDNSVAISFRNFLLSSAGQDILKKYDYDNIDGYKNSVDDLFNPTSRAKQASGENPVDVADALSNGK